MSSPENPTNQAPDPKAEGSTGQATNDGKANNRGNILIRFLLNIPSIFSGFFSRRASNFKVIMLGFAGTLLMGWGGFYASSGMFRQFFIERDKGPIHPDGRRCPI